MSDIAIKVDSLSKVYKLYDKPSDRLKEAINPFGKKYHRDFYALKDVSFEVKKGGTIGIIGKNGSGKSTLLKILTGVLSPSGGKVHVHGKISSLLELGVGFNPELTGLENVYFNGAVLGFTKEEIDKKLDAILQFADIGEFIGQPVKTYSSGMQVRLAFAVAISVDPDILVVDEALAVGDIRFQQKCYRKFREIQASGKTIIFVTHDTGVVNNYCNRAIWLDDGSVKKMGSPESVTKDYVSFMYYGMESASEETKTEIRNVGSAPDVKDLDLESVAGCQSFGEGGAKITRVGLYSVSTGEKIKVFKGGEKVNFYVEMEILQMKKDLIFGFFVKDIYGNGLFGLSSDVLKSKIDLRSRRSLICFEFDFPFLKNGNYFFTVAVCFGTQENHVNMHWVHDAYIVTIVNPDDGHAVLANSFLLTNGDIISINN